MTSGAIYTVHSRYAFRRFLFRQNRSGERSGVIWSGESEGDCKQE
ncbi:MAG: hypothetical protein QF668_03125 [Arenicellales bacterium]|nr:hypothetical protein [Arenicellales bacterium]